MAKLLLLFTVATTLLGSVCCSVAQMMPSLPAFTAPGLSSKKPNATLQATLKNATPHQIKFIEGFLTPRVQKAMEEYKQASSASPESWQAILSRPKTQRPQPMIAGTSGGITSGKTLPLLFTNGTGHGNSLPGVVRSAPVSNAAAQLAKRQAAAAPEDLDGDGLTDTTLPGGLGDLESGLAQAFMPLYHISTGEGSQFATYGNYVPWTVVSTVGSNPPNSYFHVTPLGIYPDAYGNTQGFVRIDYLSLWDGDGGLVGGDVSCAYSYFGLDDIIQALSGHPLDAERTVFLVGAPLEYGSYNQDPNAYSIYSVYTAAHEGTITDQSMYYDYMTDPIPANNHLNIAQSLSKHSSYVFNPDYYPILPAALIDSILDGIESAIAGYEFDEYEYGYYGGGSVLESLEIALAAAEDVIYGCVVERFGDQGGVPPFSATNVGEVAVPLNGCDFIQDNSQQALMLASKLTDAVF